MKGSAKGHSPRGLGDTVTSQPGTVKVSPGRSTTSTDLGRSEEPAGGSSVQLAFVSAFVTRIVRLPGMGSEPGNNSPQIRMPPAGPCANKFASRNSMARITFWSFVPGVISIVLGGGRKQQASFGGSTSNRCDPVDNS